MRGSDAPAVLDDAKTHRRLLLTEIDAQAFGTLSRDHVRKVVLRREVVVHEQGKSKYERPLARLAFDGKDVAEAMKG